MSEREVVEGDGRASRGDERSSRRGRPSILVDLPGLIAAGAGAVTAACATAFSAPWPLQLAADVGAVAAAYSAVRQHLRRRRAKRLSPGRTSAISVELPVQIVLFDAAGTPTASNPVADRYLGSGGAWILALHEEDRERYLDAWARAISSRQGFSDRFRVRRLDGELRWHLVRLHCLSREPVERDAWLGSALDVHDQVSLEDRVRLLERRGAGESGPAAGGPGAGPSGALDNPATAIDTNLDYAVAALRQLGASGAVRGEEGWEVLDEAKRGAERVRGLVRKLSTLTRSDAPRPGLPAPAASPPPETSTSRPPSAERARVLVVDDDLLVGRGIVRMIGRIHDVEHCRSPEAAIARFEKGDRFDVILSDYNMPGMTGLELFNWVSQHAPSLATRMVFMTGGARPAELQGHPAEARVWLDKPFPQAVVLGAIEKVLAKN